MSITGSRSPSPSSVQYRGYTRTPSPTPSGELAVDLPPHHHKESPTPDRDSLHIEMVAGNVDNQNRGNMAVKRWLIENRTKLKGLYG